MKLLILGCVAQKRNTSAPAKDLYTSPLWQKRRRYAEECGCLWRILSAKYGLIEPECVIDPYDTKISQVDKDQEAWLRNTVAHQTGKLKAAGYSVIEIHAGRDYVDCIYAANPRLWTIEEPLEGLGIGQQLQWYDTQHAARTQLSLF